MSLQRTIRRARQRAAGFNLVQARRVFRSIKAHAHQMKYVERLADQADISALYVLRELERDPRATYQKRTFVRPSRRGWPAQSRARMNPREGTNA